VSINSHIWTSKPTHHIWPTDVPFPVFHCSTKNKSTMINSSPLYIQLRFLHSSNRPFPSCLLPLCQNEFKYKTIHMTFAYRFIQLIFMWKVSHRLVLKRRQKETFIHELLTGAFDLKTCPVTWIIRFTCFKESATLQDRPRADRFTAFVFHINPYKPHIFWKLSSSRLWLIPLKISKS